MLLALAALAHAEPVACAPPEVFFTSPAPLATDVPVDVVPAGLLDGGGCGGGSWTATLTLASTGDTVVEVSHAASDGALIEVDPGEDLLPDETYTLVFQPDDGSGERVEIGFTTGEGTTVGLSGAPTVESAIASWQREGTTMLQAEVGVAAAEEGASIVVFSERGGEDLAYSEATGPTTVLLNGSAADASAPDEVCLVARQRDLAGRWTESEEVCVAPDTEAASDGGCLNTARGAPAGALAVLLAAALARRSRR